MASIFVPEILKLILEHISSNNALFNLALTSRQFNEVATPLLYRHVTISKRMNLFEDPDPDCGPRALSALRTLAADRRGVRKYIRSLIVNGLDKRLEQELDGQSTIDQLLTDALGGCSNLNSLRFELTTLLLHSSLSSSKQLPSLSSLYLRFDNYSYFKWSGDHGFFFPLCGFKSLTSLEIYGIYGPLFRYVGHVTNVLVACPSLQKLGLSISDETTEYGNDDDEVGDEEEEEIEVLVGEIAWNAFDDFWESTCSRYGRLSDVRLPIQSLILGHGMYMRSSTDGKNFLSQMLDLESLESLVYNNRSGNCIGWFQLDSATSLSHITVPSIDYAMLDFLDRRSGPLVELKIVEHVKNGEDIDRLLRILPKIGIERLSLNEETSLNEAQLAGLAKCTSLNYLAVRLEHDEQSDNVSAFSCLASLVNIRTLCLHNPDGKSFIKSYLIALLQQGNLEHLYEFRLGDRGFRVERRVGHIRLAPAHVLLENNR